MTDQNAHKPLEQAKCARCGCAIDLADHYRVFERGGVHKACFCRLEHIVAWAIKGARWPGVVDGGVAEGPLLLERIRMGERLEMPFDGPDQLRRWANAGGFWADR